MNTYEVLTLVLGAIVLLQRLRINYLNKLVKELEHGGQRLIISTNGYKEAVNRERHLHLSKIEMLESELSQLKRGSNYHEPL